MLEMDIPLPTRLIHIINDETCTHPTLRLVTTRGQRGQYLSLSHCWGTLRPECITTCDSLQRNLTEIPWDSLPLTFQEAAIFTARLGFRFLWIDSMCIIQDDIDDWRREAANMADIYSNSFLTIAATHGSDGSKGLFSKIPPEFEAFSIPRTGLKSEVYFRQNLDHFEVFNESMVIGKQTFADIFPLMFRAWTFQELQLSRRSVYFLRSEVQWECLEAKRCECHPETQPTTKTLLTYESRNIDLRKAPWMLNVVKFYVARALSFSRDKLPALAGLARKFERMNPELGRYCVGLWEKTLKTDFCWHVDRRFNSVFKKRPAPWRAPTWSWASIDEAIEKPLLIARSSPRCCSAAHPIMAKAKLTDVWKAVVILAGPDRFGEISSAHLIISADVFPAILSYQTLQYENENAGIEAAIFIEGQLFLGMVPDYLLCEPGENFIPPQSDVFLMYCGEDEFGCVVTVILTCVDPKSHVFKRIGSWTSMNCKQADWIDLLDWRRIVFKWI